MCLMENTLWNQPFMPRYTTLGMMRGATVIIFTEFTSEQQEIRLLTMVMSILRKTRLPQTN
ncbi:hypothetical protein C496_08956 [Natronorubrum tibetense GA33]|uniref:Uncharacterized protein n=1 Tax=Natronorubrum tibetense GA33 TaxID=1114856 RepID=L9VY08_9EURY|nr:hypothetical protein C496_08956 [Natronorubrum tibetense GA33]